MPAIGMPGTTELIIIAVVILVVFGASRLPEIGRNLGSGIRLFKRGLSNLDDDVDLDFPELEAKKSPKKRKRTHKHSKQGKDDKQGKDGKQGKTAGTGTRTSQLKRDSTTRDSKPS